MNTNKKLLVLLFFLPLILTAQISVIKVTKQRDMFVEKVIECGWPKYVESSWYGQPYVNGLTTDQISAIWFGAKYGPRTFYTNISENQRIQRGDSILLISGGGAKYQWNTGDTTRIIKVAPIDTTPYTVTITDDNRSISLTTTVFVEDRIVTPIDYVNIGNDKTICEGDVIQLTSEYNASNNITYKWSTGDTTKSITVTPTITQQYWVEVTDGTKIFKDEILIILIKCK